MPDLRAALEDDGHVLHVTWQELAVMERIVNDAAKAGRDPTAAAEEALRAVGMTDAYIAERRGKVTRIEIGNPRER